MNEYDILTLMVHKERFDRELREQLEKLGVAVVYLYGSEALGLSSALSDIDVGIVLKAPGNVLKDRRLRYRLHTQLMDLLEPVFPSDPQKEFDLVFLRAASPVLQFQAINAGCPLFVADPTFRADYEASVMRAYLDVRPLVEAHFQAALERAA